MGGSGSKRRMHTVHLSSHPDYPQRAPVKNIYWSVPEPEYAPVDFTSPKVLEADRSKDPKGWADPAEVTDALRKEISQRLTHSLKVGAKVKLVHGLPRNPVGRTGITGRGLLGRYGPNQAADALVTRFNEQGNLEMIAIKRGDNGSWAIPGGMLNGDETPRKAAIRELFEEAISKEASQKETKEKLKKILLSGRAAVYIGYVDDPRNTDISWMETTVFHFHLNDDLAKSVKLEAGDDAKEVKWLEVNDSEPDFKNLYASHHQFVLCAIAKHRGEFLSTLPKIGLT